MSHLLSKSKYIRGLQCDRALWLDVFNPRLARYTAELLGKGDGVALFEAGFLYDDVLVLADVVQQREDGTLDIYEVKSGTALSETYRHDAALQHYVISHCREVHSFSVVHAGNAGVSPAHPGFAIVDLTEELAAQHDEIARNIAAMKEILSHGEPATPTGQHCLEPYACPYPHYCAQGVRQMSLFG